MPLGAALVGDPTPATRPTLSAVPRSWPVLVALGLVTLLLLTMVAADLFVAGSVAERTAGRTRRMDGAAARAGRPSGPSVCRAGGRIGATGYYDRRIDRPVGANQSRGSASTSGRDSASASPGDRGGCGDWAAHPRARDHHRWSSASSAQAAEELG